MIRKKTKEPIPSDREAIAQLAEIVSTLADTLDQTLDLIGHQETRMKLLGGSIDNLISANKALIKATQIIERKTR